ncbi:MAG: hypothetical protein EBX52_00785 [Proteobacteria bacterium]|nr:hypothetical protein [Pseudomonadota bacterium]
MLWVLTWIFAVCGVLQLIPFVRRGAWSGLSPAREAGELRSAAIRLRVIEEMLLAGTVPAESEWRTLDAFPAPWNLILISAISELREQGAPVLPTLARIRRMLQDEAGFLLDAGVKVAPALSQAVLALALIPVFGGILFATLPGIREAGVRFGLLLLFSFLLSSFAFLRILVLAERARFGAVSPVRRAWWVLIPSTMERILSLISSGRPPDLAWRIAISGLHLQCPSLAGIWGVQVWDPFQSPVAGPASECERIMMGLGGELRRSIQTSLIEGRTCLERIESIHCSGLIELRSLVRKELDLLPNRCLGPLFLFVLPAVAILLCGCVWLSFPGAGS